MKIISYEEDEVDNLILFHLFILQNIILLKCLMEKKEEKNI